MRCVANYEIGSDVSVVTDDLVLTIDDPHGTFKVRIKNIPRSEFTTPFLLSCHIYFEAPKLGEAQEIADELLAKFLNILAFTTSSGFRKHRIRQIVDAEAPSTGKTRQVLMWGEKVEFDDPQPFLNEDYASSIVRLMGHDIPPAIRRALRWFRLGIDADSPDDQFTYFWFAIEIVAEFQKPTERVNDTCPHCQSPLYCQKCEKHPEHRPYPKQAIRALIKVADPACDDATVNLLDMTRNRLMHGSTLREIELELAHLHEHIVDTLGRILWKALLLQFPREMFDGKLAMGVPSTYVHYSANAVAHVETVVPLGQDGHFDLDFKGFKVELIPSGPPQSASPFELRLKPEQFDQLYKFSYRKSEAQEMLKRIREHAEKKDGQIYVTVFATDMSTIRNALKTKQDGEWQDLFRELLEPIDGYNS